MVLQLCVLGNTKVVQAVVRPPLHAGAETLYRDALTTPVAGIVQRLTAMKRLLK